LHDPDGIDRAQFLHADVPEIDKSMPRPVEGQEEAGRLKKQLVGAK
jgi:hypothetical protein